MARPVALVGKRREQVLALVAAKVSDREIARRFNVDHKTISKIRKESTPKAARRGVSGAQAPDVDVDPAELLDSDLKIRVELRDGLLADFRRASEPRERSQIARELTSCLDQIRKVISDPGPGATDGGEDDEAEAFVEHMSRVFEKARIVVEAAEPTDAGLPGEAESAGAVGPEEGSGGAHAGAVPS